MSKINVSTITNRTGTSGPVLSGVTTATNGFHVTGGSIGIGTNNPTADLEISNTNGPIIYLQRDNTTTPANRSLGQIVFRGNDSSGTFQSSARISAASEKAHSDDDKPTNLTFWTAPDNSATVVERLRISANGDLGINTTGGNYTVQMHEPSTGSFTLQLTTGAIGAASTSGARITASSSRKLYFENQENEDTLFYNNGGEKLVIKSGGNLEISNGDLVVADGHGIDFSATGQVAGMTNELLDDYEEGVYTVVMSDTGSGTITVNSNDDQAQYVKIGNLVTVSGRPLVGSVSSPTGDLRISLPFVPAALTEAAERSPASLYIRLCASGSDVGNFTAAINDGSAILQLGYASGTDQVASGPRVQAGTQIWFSVTYRAA